MPIKPIDMQVLLPNVQKAAKPQNVKNTREDVAVHQQQQKDEKTLQNNQKRVSNLEQKEKSEIKNDQKENRGHEKSPSKSKKKKEEEEEEKKIQMKVHGSTFDMKV